MTNVTSIKKDQLRLWDFSGLIAFLNSGDQSKEARVWRNASRNFKYMVWQLARGRFPHKDGGYQFGQEFDQYPKAVRETIKQALREISEKTIQEFEQCGESLAIGGQREAC